MATSPFSGSIFHWELFFWVLLSLKSRLEKGSKEGAAVPTNVTSIPLFWNF